MYVYVYTHTNDIHTATLIRLMKSYLLQMSRQKTRLSLSINADFETNSQTLCAHK